MRYIYILFFFTFSAFAQTSLTTEFLADSTIPTDDALRAHLSGKNFNAKPAAGAAWRMQYKADGYAFINISNGYSDSGKWRVEKGQLCTDFKKTTPSCSDTRLKNEVLYVKRVSNGEILAFEID